jgi:uncharacterized protein DUF4340
MRFTGLLIASVVLAGLAAGLWYSNKQKAAEAAKPPSDASPKILSLTDADIRKIDIKKVDGRETAIEKDKSGTWQMTAPSAYLVDKDSASQLSSSVSNVSSDRVVEEKGSNLNEYGLVPPNIEVDVTLKDGKTKKLLIGDDTPTGSGAFAMLEGDPRVFTIASYTKTGFDKTVNDLRDKRLLTFDQDKLSRVELSAKKQDIEFGRNKDSWQILKPKPLRADSLQVDELVRKLKDAKMDLAISDEDAKKAAAAFTSGTPAATVKLTDPSGTQELQVRKNKDDYYAKSSSVEGVHKVTTDVGTGLDKGLDDFRNKKLFDFGFNDPNKVEMHAGGKSYTFQKSGEDWLSSGKKMDNISVQNLLDKLRELAASKFPDTGFTTSTIDITVTSSDGKRVEKVLIAQSGKDYVAKRENEPSLYQIDAKNIDELTKAAGDVKEAPAAPAKKK